MADFSVKCTKISGTAALYFSFFALGLCAAIPGPTLLDLQQVVHTQTSKIAFIYLARSSGYLFGSLIGGIIFDMIKNPEIILILCNFIMAVSALATPWSRSVEALISILAVGGVAMGALDTGGNVVCLNIWGKDSAPYYQALHFLFGLGAFFAPLIAEPFLSNIDEENVLLHDFVSSNESVIYFSNMTSSENSTIQSNKTIVPLLNSTIPLVTYAYTIIGCYTVCVSFIFVIIFLLCPQKRSSKSVSAADNQPESNVIFTVMVALIAQVLLSMYCGMEIGYGQMLATFAVKGNLKLSKSVGSFLTAVFWGTFTFARGVSVFLSSKLAPFTILFGDLVIIILGSVILLVLGNTQAEFLWLGTVLLAIGLSSFYPTVITWIERYINVTNKIASLFVIAASAGEMVIPLAVSQFIESVPLILLYIVFGCAVSGCILTFLLWFTMTRKGEKYSSAPSKDTNLKQCDSSM